MVTGSASGKVTCSDAEAEVPLSPPSAAAEDSSLLLSPQPANIAAAKEAVKIMERMRSFFIA